MWDYQWNKFRHELIIKLGNEHMRVYFTIILHYFKSFLDYNIILSYQYSNYIPLYYSTFSE